MTIGNTGSFMRRLVVASLAAATLLGAAEITTPAQAMPVSVTTVAPAAVTPVAYYRHWHRRYYRRALPVPCRGGRRSHISRRYC